MSSKAPLMITASTPDMYEAAHKMCIEYDLHTFFGYNHVQIPPMPRLEAQRLKPQIIWDAAIGTEGPILWIDADCEVLQRPTALFNLGRTHDIALYSSGGVYTSAVMGFRNLDVVVAFCSAWIKILEDDGTMPDAAGLLGAIAKTGAKICPLPYSYCYDDRIAADGGYPKLDNPVIRHPRNG